MLTQINATTRGGVSMAFEGTESASYEREKLSLDERVKWRKAHRKTVAQATETLKDASMFALLVVYAAELGARSAILAAKESVKPRKAPPRGDIEQLRDRDYWED
jgi:hypothetical protein